MTRKWGGLTAFPLLFFGSDVKEKEADTHEDSEDVEKHNGRDGRKDHSLAFSAKKTLAIQKNSEPTNPDTIISNFSMSSSETKGLKTKVANTTCPTSAKIEDRALRCEEVRAILISLVILLEMEK